MKFKHWSVLFMWFSHVVPGYLISSGGILSMDAKNLGAKNMSESDKDMVFSQAVGFTTVQVKSLKDAINQIQSADRLLDKYIFVIGDTGEIFFQYEGNELANPSPNDKLDERPLVGNSPNIENDVITANQISSSGPFDKLGKIKSGGKKKGKEGVEKVVKATQWVLQKVDDVVYEKFNGFVPVTPCLDSRQGDGGTISFSRSYVNTHENKLEKIKRIGINLYLSYTKSSTTSEANGMDETITAKVPKGEMAQIFVKNPTLVSGTFNQVLYRIGDREEAINSSIFKTKMIDNDQVLEYHILLGEDTQYRCGSVFSHW